MKLPPFSLDRWLAAHEFASPPIRYNLASSTGPAWTLGDVMALAGDGAREELDSLRLSYMPPEGSKRLREQIAAWYGVDPDWVIVTTGAAEALSAVFCLVAEPGASIALPSPSFPSMPALARAWGLDVRTYSLDRTAAFAQTADQILSVVDETTRLVLVNSPHNPTGSVISDAEIARLGAVLADRGIPWVMDEVYHPLYFGTPSRSAVTAPGTIVISDLSKAFSLSGLRVGWIIDRDPERRRRLIDLRGYFTVSGSPLSDAIATYAFAHRETILARLNAVARTNLASLTRFVNAHRNIVAWVPPSGGTVAFPWLVDRRDSRSLCESLARAGVLVVPGDCFDAPAHFRIGVGAQADGFEDALAVASDVLASASRPDV